MGAEELEESEFEPMFSDCESKLGGKKIALFGSYGWGDGEWMRTWEDTCRGDGASVVSNRLSATKLPTIPPLMSAKPSAPRSYKT